MTSDGYCSTCVTGYTLYNNKCISCSDTTNGGISACSTCTSNTTTNTLTCNTCVSGYALNTYTNTCNACPSGCQTCSVT